MAGYGPAEIDVGKSRFDDYGLSKWFQYKIASSMVQKREALTRHRLAVKRARLRRAK